MGTNVSLFSYSINTMKNSIPPSDITLTIEAGISSFIHLLGRFERRYTFPEIAKRIRAVYSMENEKTAQVVRALESLPGGNITRESMHVAWRVNYPRVKSEG